MSTLHIPQGEPPHHPEDGAQSPAHGPPPDALADPALFRPGTTERRPATPKPRRPWSARRVAAAVTASLIAFASGALLFEAVWTRTGNHANAWWTTLSNELATRPVDDVWILTGAATAAALGLCLLILALTPGMRRKLPMKVPDNGPAEMRAVVDRKSAALLLRDAAMRVPGVGTARVHVSRRRIKVRADTRFRDPAEVETELAQAVQSAASQQLRLTHTPKPKFRVRRGPT